MKKAFLVIPHWSDCQDKYEAKNHYHPVYAETASKAKYRCYLELEDDSEDWFKYRVYS